MYPLVRELAARGAPIRVPVTVEYDKPIWPHCAGRSLANVTTPERQELRWDDVVQRRSTPSGRRSSAC